jgi:asparagine synthase (glutamine-hydrolysing)
MCGLAGLVRFDAPIASPEAIGDALCAALAHRGRDGEGRYVSDDRRALLVHRRLAIIDPSPRAAHPMATPDRRYHLNYDGRVYDAASRIESDTEALLHMLLREGPATLGHARGMFALALWDAHERTLLVARDRFGIKPLYLSLRPDAVAFASEVGALRRAGLAARDVAPAAVLGYLAWGTVPQPLTWLSGVEALEPGTWRKWHADGTEESGQFADAIVCYANGNQLSETALRTAARDAVVDSVRAHLVADVPVGVLLSGGINSGAIVSAASSSGYRNLHTYTLRVDQQTSDDAARAAATARRFGTTHHDLRMDASRIAGDLDAIVARLDQPTAHAAHWYYLSKAVATTGVNAVLSGVGGDALFGGSPSFQRIPAALAVTRRLGPFTRIAGVAGRAMPAWRAATWRHFTAAPRMKTAYRAMRGLFMPEELGALAGPALRDQSRWSEGLSGLAAAERRVFDAAGPEADSAAVGRMELRGFLGSQLLRDSDVMSMAHGLEVRTPFVDHQLQETLWPSLAAYPALQRGGRLLHETLAARLPTAVTDAPRRGSLLPCAVWLRGPLAAPMREGIDALVRQQWLDGAAASRLWSEWEHGHAHWSRVWALGILGRFLDQAP